MGRAAVFLRYVTFWVARSIGVVRRWVNTEWRPFVLTLLAVALAVWSVDTLRPPTPVTPSASRSTDSATTGRDSARAATRAGQVQKPSVTQGRLLNAATVLGVWAIGALLVWAWRARRRLVIDEFIDHAADKDKTSPAKGVSALLVAELGRLRDLYRNIDEERPIPSAVADTKALGVTFNVEDVSEYLKSAVSAESKITLGFLSVPVGSIFALFGKLVQGPRITGSLYLDGDTRVLVAQIIGADRAWTWRVEAETIAGKPPRITEMVVRLSFAMFTDLALGGNLRWQAVEAFCEGLRAYRETLTTEQDKPLKRKRAEQNLRKALSYDDRLQLAHYNLAVVFEESGNHAAAASEFGKAIERDPTHWRCYYALATVWFNWPNAAGADETRRYATVIDLCARAAALAPEPAAAAAAWDLRGRAERLAGRLDDALISRRRATRLGWRALCRQERRGLRLSNRAMRSVRGLAANCIRNLAVACLYQADAAATESGRATWLKRAVRLINQASWATPADGELYSLLGRTYLKLKQLRRAAAALNRAAGMASDDLQFQGELASVMAQTGDKARALVACAQLLDRASEASEDALNSVAEAFDALDQPDDAQRVRGMRRVLSEIDAMKADDIPELERLLATFEKEGHAWEAGQCCYRLGMLHTEQQDYKKARDRYAEAIGHFTAHEGEIRRYGLRALVARSERSIGNTADAVRLAEEAARLDPLSVFERQELARCYRATGDYQSAITALEVALLSEPNKPELHWDMGWDYWRLARQRRSRAERDAALTNSRQCYERALDLYPEGHDSRVALHYFIGRLHQELGQFASAISQMELAYNQQYSSLTTSLYLGQAHLHDRRYDTAAAYFREVIDDGEKRIADKADPTQPSDTKSGDEFLLGSTIAWACVMLAYCEVSREANLDTCLSLVEQARKYLALAKDESDTCRAACACCEGMVFLAQNRPAEAVAKLEEAVGLDGDPEYYHQLARAYERRAEIAPDPRSRLEDLRRAASRCERSTEVDFHGEFTAQVTKLQAAVADKLKDAEADVKATPRPDAQANGGKKKKAAKAAGRAAAR